MFLWTEHLEGLWIFYSIFKMLFLGAPKELDKIHRARQGREDAEFRELPNNHSIRNAGFEQFFVLWRTQRQVLVFQKGAKSWSKIDPGSDESTRLSPTLTLFWTVFLKPGFQSLTVERHVSNPLWSLGSLNYNPNGRTPNGRTDGTSDFDHPTDVKSASRNNILS